MRDYTLVLSILVTWVGAGLGDDVSAVQTGKVDSKANAIAAVVGKQDAAARAQWKKIFRGAPPSYETPYLLLYGAVTGKTLKEVAATLDQQMELARAALKLENSPWPGKLTVYLVPERGQFVSLVRGIERRNPEPEETGSLDIRGEPPHVIAGPPRSSTDPSVENEAGQLIASGLLIKKAGPAVPDWVTDGFGRATVLVAGPKTELAAEHRKASRVLVSKKRRAQDLWEGNLPADEAGPLRAAMIEYLAYSKRFSRFEQFLAGFRVEENRQNPTTLDALKTANVNPDQLNAKWQAWVKASR